MGVSYVMKHFFSSFGKTFEAEENVNEDDEIVCDEEALDKFS
ncbi:hypothetical protein HALO153_130001 [Vreelandella titanicae]|nr:hypothetical protein HALO153_130001 [Halomonas titanicae]